MNTTDTRPAVEQELAAALLARPEADFSHGSFQIPLADDQDPSVLTDAGLLRTAHLRALERAYVSAEAARLAWAARLDAGLLGHDALAAAPFHLRHEGGADYLDAAGDRLFGASWRGADRLDRIAARLVLWDARRSRGTWSRTPSRRSAARSSARGGACGSSPAPGRPELEAPGRLGS